MPTPFKCLLVQKDSSGIARRSVTPLTTDQLPPGDVLIRVEHSSLNYKDALAATGRPGVSKLNPLVPGIDAAGIVVESASPNFQSGQSVAITGFGFGVEQFGGYAEYARAPADWVVPLPAGLSPRESMIMGTAGFTAAMSVFALERHSVLPGGGPILVTGASGGVGTIAVALLAKAGYEVHAASGKTAAADLLKQLGAARLLNREAVLDSSTRPMLTAHWAGAIDTVGGPILATVVRSIQPRGCVACCGLTAGADLPLTVYPFILRGVTLAGIDSVFCPMPERLALWARLASDWKILDLERLVSKTVALDQLDEPINAILAGQITGRVVVKP